MEESVETGELQEKLNEAIERAEEAGEERASPKWTLQLALSTAIIAVIAALASLQAGSLANHALLIKNEAVLTQAKASDQWAYYQAKGIKAVIYQAQGKNLKEAKRYKDEQSEIKQGAEELESKIKEYNEESDHLLHRHHQFALSVTFFQVSIALAAIASLTRRKALWYLGLAIAAAGLVFFTIGI